jgi:hypothetical protein
MEFETNTEYIQPITSERQLTIANKSFIHSPAKEKAKTSKIEFWPYQKIRWHISVPGIIDKT